MVGYDPLTGSLPERIRWPCCGRGGGLSASATPARPSRSRCTHVLPGHDEAAAVAFAAALADAAKAQSQSECDHDVTMQRDVIRETPGQGHYRRVRRQGLEPRTRGLRVAWPSATGALPARIPPAFAELALIAPVSAGDSVHEPVHDLLQPSADANYTTLLWAPKADASGSAMRGERRRASMATTALDWRRTAQSEVPAVKPVAPNASPRLVRSTGSRACAGTWSRSGRIASRATRISRPT
jgi:hypothetical protein